MPAPGLALLPLRCEFLHCISCREGWLCLTRHAALTSFRRNLSLVKELGDRAAQGRAYGNLGNTQYLLGNFSEAIAFHKEVGNLLPGVRGWDRLVASSLSSHHSPESTGRCLSWAFSLPPVCTSGSGPTVLTHAEQHLTPIPVSTY